MYLIFDYLVKRNKQSEGLIGLIRPSLGAPAICLRYNHNAVLIEPFESLSNQRVIR